jgi:hypothetical protein
MCNHNLLGQRSLEDVIGIMAHQIRALGHSCVWRKENDKLLLANSGINIMVEGFTLSTIQMMADFYAKGARFMILATEEPTPNGFNHGLDPEMRERQKLFPEAAKYAEGILHLVPGKHVTDWYSQFCPSAPAELGYAPTLVRNDDFEPDFDFGFYGSITPRRFKILKKLARAIRTEKAVKVMGDFKSQDERDKDMRRARVIVQLRKFDKMGLVSSSRLNTALSLGRPVICEPHELSRPWDEVVKFSSSLEQFFTEDRHFREDAELGGAGEPGIWRGQQHRADPGEL